MAQWLRAPGMHMAHIQNCRPNVRTYEINLEIINYLVPTSELRSALDSAGIVIARYIPSLVFFLFFFFFFGF